MLSNLKCTVRISAMAGISKTCEFGRLSTLQNLKRWLPSVMDLFIFFKILHFIENMFLLTYFRNYAQNLCPKLVPLPVIITTITQDEKHTTATDGSDGETSTARSNLVAAAIWQNMKKGLEISAIKATSFLFKNTLK